MKDEINSAEVILILLFIFSVIAFEVMIYFSWYGNWLRQWKCEWMYGTWSIYEDGKCFNPITK